MPLKPASVSSAPGSFALGVSEKIGFYVYLLIDPRDESVFYVGKGTGHRCFSHLAEAQVTGDDTTGDYEKLDRIRDIESSGLPVRIDILRHGLGEHEAFLVESAAIDLVSGLTNRHFGHEAVELGRRSVSEINALYGATPVTIDPSHCVVLIRINRNFERGITDDALYEATRKWWKVRASRQELGKPGAPQWAMAIFGGIVRAVYRIEAWERPSEEDIGADPIDFGRWGFRGRRDFAMEEIYLNRDISSYLRNMATGNPSQNPIRYVNCIKMDEGPVRPENITTDYNAGVSASG